MKIQYLLLLLVILTILARDVMCARNENEPDENEPDEDEPDEDEPNEHYRHHKQHGDRYRPASTSIVHSASTPAHVGSPSIVDAASVHPSNIASSGSSWVSAVAKSAPVASPSSSTPSFSVGRPITGLASSGSNRLEIYVGIPTISILAFILMI